MRELLLTDGRGHKSIIVCGPESVGVAFFYAFLKRL